MKRSQLVATCLLLGLMLILPISTALPALANEGQGKGSGPLPVFLDGTRINLLLGGSPTLPADQPCFVIHGFGDVWKDLTVEEKKSLLKDQYFTLKINGEPVELKRVVYFCNVPDSPDDQMRVMYYVEFEAGHFATGTYTFTGTWYSPGGTSSKTVTVTFS